MKWDWLWRGDMWAQPDPEHKPEYHTLGEDVRDLLKLVLRALGWVVTIASWVAAAVLALWIVLYLYGAARIAPSWVWLIVVPLLGIWWQIARLARKKESDAPPR